MGFNVLLAGHGWQRKVGFNDGGTYTELDMPGGGVLVSELLQSEGHTVAPWKLAEPVRTEHLIASPPDRAGCLVSEAFLGTSGTGSVLESGQVDAALAVIWDEGLEEFPIPSDMPIVWASCRRLPPKQQYEQIKARVFLLLSADLLRKSGALISRRMSWERTATDLVWQLRFNPSFRYLLGTPELLIPFCEDGAVYIRQTATGWEASLTLADGGFEGQQRERSGPVLLDSWAVMTAAAAHEKLRQTQQHTVFDTAAALMPAHALAEHGLPIEAARNRDFSGWLTVNTGSARTWPIPPIRDESAADRDYWCISRSVQNTHLQDMASRYVLEGAEVIQGLPRFSCGHLTTVDRQEIEAFGNIRNLIVAYAKGKADRPLSIAVFGAPGSGKSFGVTQIAQNVLPEVVKKLEFNVSQMTGPEDLAAAFHKVRDVALSGGLPLVFFDEFDSDRDGRPLGWLKSFLMPMQDGKFRDDSGEHPVGKCIMVFAGGTCATFEDFCRPMDLGHTIEKNAEDFNILKETPERFAFKQVKGPDFVSRLRGTINILGPNPAFDGEQNYILRRALLLRSLLERRKLTSGSQPPVSADVLRAMLLVPRYKHGARSMEAILDMSRLEEAPWNAAALPFTGQLDLHVDAGAFLRLVLNDVMLSASNERLARAIHDDFLAKWIHADYVEKQKDKPGTVSLVPWEELSEELRDANRAQALDIPNKLLNIQCCFDAGDTPYPSVESLSQEEILHLAQHEHQRWMMHRAASGWKYGPVRDEEKKLHPDMVPWEELSQEAMQKDIDAVENIIPLLKKAGLRVYRMV